MATETKMMTVYELELMKEHRLALEKQKAKARQAFQRSAQQAGYSEQGKDRLVQPAGTPTSQSATPGGATQKAVEKNGGDGGFVPPSGLPPTVKMLLRALPGTGQEWPEDEQEAWLDSMRDALRASYSPSPTPETASIRRRSGCT